jgi:alpha-glucosidase
LSSTFAGLIFSPIGSHGSNRGSLLNLYRDLIAFRRETPALSGRDFVPLATNGGMLAFERNKAGHRLRIAPSMGPQTQSFAFGNRWRVAISTLRDRAGEPLPGSVTLRPHEGLIAEYGGELC